MRELRDVGVVSLPAYPAASVECATMKEPRMSTAVETRAAFRTDDPAPEPTPTRQGTLGVEDRPAASQRPIQARIMDAMRGDETRLLRDADASTGLIATGEVSTYIWDLLRPALVVSRARAVT